MSADGPLEQTRLEHVADRPGDLVDDPALTTGNRLGPLGVAEVELVGDG